MERFIDSHLTLERLAAYLDGNLPANEMQEIDALSVNNLLLQDMVLASDRIDDVLASAEDSWETEMIDLDAVELPDVQDVGVETIDVVALSDEYPVEVSAATEDVVLMVTTEDLTAAEATEMPDTVTSLPNVPLGTEADSFAPFPSSSLDNDTEQLEIME